MPTTIWIENFKGLHDSASPGAKPVITTDLRNVKVTHGQVRPRGGLTKYLSITAASSAEIIQLFHYPLVSGTNKLLRMLPTALHVLNTGTSVWDDVTGTALTGTTTTRPQSTIMDDILVLTNEGEDLPRKYGGSGNSTPIAASTSPYAKAIESYEGFLMLGDISDDGTFTDVFDGHRMIRYSDDWDNDWTLCEGNEIVLVETPGRLLRMATLGRDLICYKSDGIVKVRWIGGKVKFSQEKLEFEGGVLAPLSVMKLTDDLQIFLGNDAVIYTVSPQGISPISFESLYNTLPITISLNKLKYARGMIDEEEATYYLFYDRSGLATMLLDSYVSYNWRTKEFNKGRVGKSIIAAVAHKPTTTSAVDLITSSATLCYEFDEGLTDDGVAVSRYVTTGWQGLYGATQTQQWIAGWFQSARLIFNKPTGAKARVRVSLAMDLDETYQYQTFFQLQGGGAGDNFVEVFYHPPSQLGSWFNMKVEFFIDNITAFPVELRRVGLTIEPTKQTRMRPSRGGEEEAA